VRPSASSTDRRTAALHQWLFPRTKATSPPCPVSHYWWLLWSLVASRHEKMIRDGKHELEDVYCIEDFEVVGFISDRRMRWVPAAPTAPVPRCQVADHNPSRPCSFGRTVIIPDSETILSSAALSKLRTTCSRCAICPAPPFRICGVVRARWGNANLLARRHGSACSHVLQAQSMSLCYFDPVIYVMKAPLGPSCTRLAPRRRPSSENYLFCLERPKPPCQF
jgi:hypothetical protein